MGKHYSHFFKEPVLAAINWQLAQFQTGLQLKSEIQIVSHLSDFESLVGQFPAACSEFSLCGWALIPRLLAAG